MQWWTYFFFRGKDDNISLAKLITIRFFCQFNKNAKCVQKYENFPECYFYISIASVHVVFLQRTELKKIYCLEDAWNCFHYAKFHYHLCYNRLSEGNKFYWWQAHWELLFSRVKFKVFSLLIGIDLGVIFDIFAKLRSSIWKALFLLNSNFVLR